MARRCKSVYQYCENEICYSWITTIYAVHVYGQALPDGCTGARPDRPIVNKQVFPNSRFHYANRTSYNDIVTTKGDKISIAYSNCDYATYRFVVSTEHITSTDTTAWIRQAGYIIKGTAPGLETVIQLDSALHYLDDVCHSHLPPFNEEIIFAGNAAAQWREVIVINRAERRKNLTTVTLTIFEGPL